MSPRYGNIRRVSSKDIICILLTALQFDLYYLLSTEFKLGQMILVLVSLYYIIRYFSIGSSLKNANTFLVLYLTLLMFTGAFQVSRLFGENFLSALLAERVIWTYIFFYFALQKLFEKNKIKNHECIRYLKISCVIQLVLYFTQWILSDKIMFLHVLSGTRYGSSRFYMSPILLIYMICFSVSNYYNRIEPTKSMIWIVAIMAEILIVQKYRMTTVSILLAILCGFLLYRGSHKRWFVLLGFGLIAVVVVINSRMGQDVISSLMGMGSDNSVNGRSAWRWWALGELRKNPILGKGFVFTDKTYSYGGQYVKRLFGWSFTPGDHGIMGFIYEYGGLGAGWYIALIITQVKKAIAVWKYNKNYAYIIFLVFIIIDSYSELYWILSNGIFVLVVYMTMLHKEYRETKKKVKVDSVLIK